MSFVYLTRYTTRMEREMSCSACVSMRNVKSLVLLRILGGCGQRSVDRIEVGSSSVVQPSGCLDLVFTSVYILLTSVTWVIASSVGPVSHCTAIVFCNSLCWRILLYDMHVHWALLLDVVSDLVCWCNTCELDMHETCCSVHTQQQQQQQQQRHFIHTS